MFPFQSTRNKGNKGPKTCPNVAVPYLDKGLLLLPLFGQVYAVYSETVSFCLVPYFTYQVNEIAEVLLNLLWRQTPHQIQGTIQLLIILRRKRRK